MTTANAAVSGGSGSYSYAWAIEVINANTATWDFTGQGTASCTPTVRHAFAGENTTATLTCTVTDGVTGAHATSNSVSYIYVNTE